MKTLAVVFGTLCCLAPVAAGAQAVAQKGFLEATGTLYPQAAANDEVRAVGEVLFRYEASARPARWLRLSAGVDARADTHDQTRSKWSIDWLDRGAQRTPLGVSRLDATISRGLWTVQVGKQIVRWGRTDILTPTDRFAPRDMLAVFDTDLTAITAARVTAGLQSDTLDIIWAPFFTPSRVPLLNQRWAVLPPLPPGVSFRDAGAEYPGGSQWGARWNHVGSSIEFSLSGFQGYNTLPLFAGRFDPVAGTASLTRVYPRIRMAGGDVAIPLSQVTLKGEAGWFGSNDPRADEYVLYVVQVERQAGEWFLVGGYGGEAVTTNRTQVGFSPDRGLTRAFLGRAGFTIDTNRSVAFDGAVRQDGRGSWLRFEYSHASGQHLRVTARASWIRGDAGDFIGQYSRNSHVTLTARYSF